MWDFPCAELSVLARVRATRTRTIRNQPRISPFSMLWNTINTGSTLIQSTAIDLTEIIEVSMPVTFLKYRTLFYKTISV